MLKPWEEVQETGSKRRVELCWICGGGDAWGIPGRDVVLQVD